MELKAVYDAISRYNMLTEGDSVVVGVSGGADSVALLHLLTHGPWRFSVTAVHVNHNLRGQAAQRDEAYVCSLCEEWEVPCIAVSVDVQSYADANGLTLEEAGRHLRRKVFEETACKMGDARIATAHHRDDSCETVLMNLLRGTGVTGLCGIRPVNGRYIHPLIDVTKRELEAYLTDHGIRWMTDETNGDTAFTRNRIRGELLPYLKANFNPNIEEALWRLSILCREEDDLIKTAVSSLEPLLQKQADGSFVLIDGELFRRIPQALQRRLLRRAMELLDLPLKDVHFAHIDSALEMIRTSQSGASMTLGKATLQLVQSGIVLTKEQKDFSFGEAEFLPGESVLLSDGRKITSSFVSKPDFSDPNRACLDADKLNGLLSVRSRRDGDVFKPYGMSHTKKLKNYLIDRKINADQRNKIPLIVYNNNIIWIAGHTINDDYKITDETRRILMLELHDR